MPRYIATVEITLEADSQQDAERIVSGALRMMDDTDIEEITQWDVEPEFDEDERRSEGT